MKISIWATAICICLVSVSLADSAKASIRKDLSIPAQDLSPALQFLAKQYDFQVLYKTELVSNVRTGGAIGTLTSDEALGRVLSGTGLTYKYLDDKTVTIVSTSSGASVQVPASDDTTKKEAGKKSSQDFRVAQNSTPVDQGNAGPQVDSDKNPQRRTKKQEAEKQEGLAEIVVTGTNIRGIAPVGSPLIVIDAEDIRRSGYTTVEQVMQSLPQNFKGGASSESYNFDSSLAGQQANNVMGGAGVNLRGLGTSATLTLLNGRRMAAATDGYFVDISAIPVDAIDRIEILTDGASAIYGSDAIGGVVNFILKRNYEGAHTDVSYGFPTDGGADQRRIAQTLGATWEGGGVLLNGSFLDQNGLDVKDRDFTNSILSPTSLFPSNRQYNLLLSLQHRFNDQLSLETDAEYADYRRFQDYTYAPASFTYFYPSSTKNYGAGGVLRYAFSDRWQISLDGGVSKGQTRVSQSARDPSQVYPPLSVQYYYLNERTATLKVDGDLLEMPAGKLKGVVGGAWRAENYISGDTYPTIGVIGKSDRDVKSAFAEFYVPLFRTLELSLAGRYDDYSDFGATTNPKIGLAWKLSSDLTWRASYGTSFRAPSNGIQLSQAFQGTTGAAVLGEAAPGGGRAPTVFLLGSTSLSPEKAKSWTTGFSYTPEQIQRLKLDINYYHINYVDKIGIPPFPANALSEPALQSFVTKYTPAQLQATLGSTLQALEAAGSFFDDTGGEFGADPLLVDPVYVYRLEQVNAAITKISGLDFNLDYLLAVGINQFKLDLNTSYIHNIDNQYSPGAPALHVINTYGNPVNWRARGTVAWARGNFDAAMAVNFTNTYTNTAILPNVPIRSNVTVDTSIRYSLPLTHGLLHNVSLSFSIVNLFDRAPPVALAPSQLFGQVPYDSNNANPLGRMITLAVSKGW